MNDFYLSNSTRKKHQKLEKEVLQNADVTLTVSETWVKDLKRLGATRVELITNGYDVNDFDPYPKTNDKFISNQEYQSKINSIKIQNIFSKT